MGLGNPRKIVRNSRLGHRGILKPDGRPGVGKLERMGRVGETAPGKVIDQEVGSEDAATRSENPSQLGQIVVDCGGEKMGEDRGEEGNIKTGVTVGKRKRGS